MRGRRVLVIEDEYLVALEIESVLQAAGIDEVVLAATELEALDEMREGQWDFVVADANLNGVGINCIAAALSERSIPFVIVSGYRREHLPGEVADVPLVAKPFRGAELVQALEQLLPDGESG